MVISNILGEKNIPRWHRPSEIQSVCLCAGVCLVSEVPQSDGGVVAGGDAELFSRMSSQTPDPSPSMTVQQYVGRRILLPNLNDFPVFRPHQDLTLKKKRADGISKEDRRRTTTEG